MTRWIAAFIVLVVVAGFGALGWWISYRSTGAPAPVAQAPAPVAQTPAPVPAPAAQTPAPASAARPGLASSSGSASTPPAAPPGSASAPTASASAPAGQPVSNPSVAAAPQSNSHAPTAQASPGAAPAPKRLVASLDHSVIHFASGTAGLPASATDDLKRAAAEMKRLPPGYKVQIAGYTDDTGAAAANVALSQKRAEAVRDALIRAGVNPDMVVAKGYGSADPIASNDTEQGRNLNRRIELQVVQAPNPAVADSPNPR